MAAGFMKRVYSGVRPGCARVRGRLVYVAGIPFIVRRAPVLGWTYFAVDPESIRLEVYHAAGPFLRLPASAAEPEE